MNIHFCYIHDFNSSYENVVDFANQYNQLDYFSKRTLFTKDLNVQTDGEQYSIDINESLINVASITYVYYKGLDNKYYFYFVTNRSFLTKNSSRLTLQLDVWQTYMFRYERMDSFVERCHVPRWSGNNPTKEYEPEDFGVGESMIYAQEELYKMGNGVIVTTTSPIGVLTSTGGGGVDGDVDVVNGSCSGTIDNPKLDKQAYFQQKFIKELYPSARYDFSKYNIFASIKLAQGALESDWGRSTLATKGNNLFGIKADSSWTGPKGQYPTTEYVNGKPVKVMAWFRHYSSWAESLHDHTQFLLKNKRYQQAGVFNAKTPEQQAECLRKAGYATDPNYPKLLMSIVNGSNLTVYDKKCELEKPAQGNYVSNKAGDNWLLPTTGTITALYPKYPSGNLHNGLDIGCPIGTDVRASKDGTVLDAKELNTSYGHFLKIQHGDSICIYGHNSKLLVKKGDKVKQGQVIAKSGNTGYSSGPHLHFEIRNDRVGEVVQYGVKTVHPYPAGKLGMEV